MFNWFKKKPKIEFVSLFPEITQIMPIVPAGKIKFNWTKSAIEDWKTQQKTSEFHRQIYMKATTPSHHVIIPPHPRFPRGAGQQESEVSHSSS